MTEFELYNDKRDQRFREQRRAKTAGRPCPACRQKAEAERAAQLESARQAKERKQHEKTERQEKPRRQTGPRRLPHGSCFNVAYDESRQAWSGILTVPGEGEWTASASGVFRLLQQLDQQYWLSKGQGS
jgi:hypothetical protein